MSPKTNRIIDDGLEQFAALNRAVESLAAARVAFQQQRVCKQTTSLPRQHHHAAMSETTTQSADIKKAVE